MQLRIEHLAAHVQQPLLPLYVLSGDEPLQLEEGLDQLRVAARAQGFTERVVQRIDSGFAWRELAALGGNLSLFGERRWFEWRLSSGKVGTEGAKALLAWANDPPPDSVTILTMPRVEKAVHTSRWWQAWERQGAVVLVWPLSLAQLPAWISARLRLQQQRANPALLAWLAERVEGNLLAAKQEIAKLGLLFPPGELDPEAVQDAVWDVARFESQQVVDALWKGELARYARLLIQFEQRGEVPTLLVWQFAEDCRAVWRLQQHPQPSAILWRELRVWGKRQELLQQAARQWSRVQLAACLRQLALIDREIKGVGQGLSVWWLLAEIARIAAGE